MTVYKVILQKTDIEMLAKKCAQNPTKLKIQ